MAETPSFLAGRATNEDHRIAQNRPSMGVVLLRKKDGSAFGSGSIVRMTRSEHFPKYGDKRLCLLTSNVFPSGEITMENYSFECDSNQTVKLGDVAKAADCYQPTAGLVLIPVHPTKGSIVSYSVSLKSSVFDDRRTFPTEYYNEESEWESDKSCFIAGSFEGTRGSWTVERFTLKTSKDDQGLFQYELQADDKFKSSFQIYDQIVARSHLRPHGAPILKTKHVKEKGLQVSCIGVLNFSDDKKITPVFFTPESLKGEVQLYYPTKSCAVVLGNSDEVDSSLEKSEVAAFALKASELEARNPKSVVTGRNKGEVPQLPAIVPERYNGESGNPSSNDEIKPCSNGYALQQKLYKDKEDECTQLNEQSKEKDKTIAKLKDHNAELRIDMKKTEQQNKELIAQNIHLHQELSEKKEELRVANNKLHEMWDTENKRLRSENKSLRTQMDEIKEKWHAEKQELQEGWNRERKELRQEMDKKLTKLSIENEKLRGDVGRVSEQLVAVLGLLATMSGPNEEKDKAGLCGSPAANNQQASHSSSEEKPFLDPLSTVVTKL